MELTLYPSQIHGKVPIVTSKSQTIRALLIAAFSKGTSSIRRPLYSSDTRSAINLIQTLGAKVSKEEEVLSVTGFDTLPEEVVFDCGNSGTTMYLAAGMVASLPVKATFTGDSQLKSRPVLPLLEALKGHKVRVSCTKGGYPPFTIAGPIRSGEVDITCHTSQHLSALLLGCVMGKGQSVINVSLLNERPYVEMTLNWLKEQNIKLSYDEDMKKFIIPGNQHYSPFDSTIAGDFSSASFFFCAGAISDSPVTVSGLNKEDPQGDKEVLTILEKMGAIVKWNGDEVTVTSPQEGLHGGHFDLNAIPDALPVLAVTACYAKGTTVLGNVPQARIKETDRIESMKRNLMTLGAHIEDTEDSLIIHGQGHLDGGECRGYGDHRIIMAMAIASLRTSGPLTIDDIDAVDVTFPTFFTLFDSIRKEI